MIEPLKKTEAGVSESLGYIMISGIMIVSFFLILSVGYPVYNNYLDNSHMRNIQESFYILSYNGNSVAMHNAPYSSSELKMYGGCLVNKDSGYIKISYYSNDDGTGLIAENNTTLSMLEYTKGSSRVAYVDGGVCAGQPEGSVMLREPEIYNTTDTFVYKTVSLYDTSVSASGNGALQIAFLTPYYAKMSQTVTAPGPASIPNVKFIEITVDGDYKDSFANYLQQPQLGFTKSVGSKGELILNKSYPGGITLHVVDNYVTIEAN